MLVYKRVPKNKNQLKQFLIEEWEILDENYLAKLVKSMPTRLSELAKNNFIHTKY